MAPQDGEHETQSMSGSLPDAPPVKQSFRSFKKKYAKMKLRFEHEVKESEALIREQLRIEDLSKRIQEQNDQLLEVLLEFNDNFHISSSLRYDLNVPGDPVFPPDIENIKKFPAIRDPTTAENVLKRAKIDVTAGAITPKEYRVVEDAVRHGQTYAPGIQYANLLKIPHTAPPPSEMQHPSADNGMEDKLGYLSPEHETEYYMAVDARLGDESAALQLSQLPEKPSLAKREREIAVTNPASIYNWMRKNQPQDNEAASEKSGPRPSNLRSSKRVSVQPRKYEDAYDEEGILMDAGPAPSSSRTKRKRDDDTGYRPKGGSSRPSRKKKDNGTSNGKQASKRSSGIS